MKNFTLGLFLVGIVACSSEQRKTPLAIGRYDEAIDQIISEQPAIDTIATGLEWSEGPVWVDKINMLLFSDVPANTIFSWSPESGLATYLTPSGYTGSVPRGGETGSNGLIINNQGQLVLCQHGDRMIAVMNASLDDPQPEYRSLSNSYNGKKLNSPNDIVQDSRGNYYFTDPPYGLVNQQNDSTKETPFQGVYLISQTGKTHLLVDSLTRPNGIALSPDGRNLFVANSDPERARWYKYELRDTVVIAGEVFYDATSMTSDMEGLPDGMKIDSNGNVYASGPGGIFIFNSEGDLLGKIPFNGPTSNCALTPDEKTLFVTNDMHVIRITLRE